MSGKRDAEFSASESVFGHVSRHGSRESAAALQYQRQDVSPEAGATDHFSVLADASGHAISRGWRADYRVVPRLVSSGAGTARKNQISAVDRSTYYQHPGFFAYNHRHTAAPPCSPEN